MKTLTALCPHCGRPIQYQSGDYSIVVCSFCKAQLRPCIDCQRLSFSPFCPLHVAAVAHYDRN